MSDEACCDDLYDGELNPFPTSCACRTDPYQPRYGADPEAWSGPRWTPSPWSRRGDEQDADEVLRIAWLRGAAGLLIEWEQQQPSGSSLAGGGLGLLAAQLLDFADLLQARLPNPRTRGDAR